MAQPMRASKVLYVPRVMVVMPRLYLRARLAKGEHEVSRSSYFMSAASLVHNQHALSLVRFCLVPDVI